VLEKVGPRAIQLGISLSPDGKTAEIFRLSSEQALWLTDLTRGVDTRFTFPPLGSPSAPIWSPDGKSIAFGNLTAPAGLYRKEACGAAREELLIGSQNPLHPSDWSRDGRFLLYTELDPKSQADLWYLPDPAGKPGDTKPEHRFMPRTVHPALI
jgi:Tol biopolymer transport system component